MVLPKQGPQTSTEPVARHCRPDGAADRIGHSRRRDERVEYERAPEGSDANTRSGSRQSLELRSAADAADQADRRWRPLSRRDFSTARPALVLIRARKPCFFARCKLLG